MKRLLAIAVLCFAGSVHAQIPVTDGAHIAADEAGLLMTLAEWGKTGASWIQQAKDMASTIKSWAQQYYQMKEQYDAITGIRNLGDIFNNRILRRNVPDDWTGIYDTAGDGLKFGDEAVRLAEVRGWENKIRSSERLAGTADNDLAAIQKRAQDMATTNKALGQRAFRAQPGLLEQLENTMNKINFTTDQKGILEVNGRLTGEAAAQSWQTNNILLMAQLQQDEKDLANQQRLGLSQRIIGNNGGGMPSIEGAP